MHIDVLSLFPSYIEGPIHESILKRAIQKGILRVSNIDIRKFSVRKDSRVDDRSFGGGPGMVMMAEPVVAAVRSCRTPSSRVVYLSPQGETLTPALAKELSEIPHLILLCGHYEGIDQRAIDTEVDQEVSIGDYVLTNGCLAALVLIDVIARFIPGVLGHEEAAAQDSFEKGIFDHPHYTQPRIFEGKEVPDVLLGGDHEKIAQWRSTQALIHTKKKRPELVACQYLAREPVEKDFLSLRQVVEPSSHFDEVIHFYDVVLGIRPEVNENRAVFSCESFSLIFFRVEGSLPPLGAMFSVVLPVDQFRKAVSWSRRKEGRIVSAPEAERGSMYAVLRDPDGRLIQIASAS